MTQLVGEKRQAASQQSIGQNQPAQHDKRHRPKQPIRKRYWGRHHRRRQAVADEHQHNADACDHKRGIDPRHPIRQTEGNHIQEPGSEAEAGADIDEEDRREECCDSGWDREIRSHLRGLERETRLERILEQRLSCDRQTARGTGQEPSIGNQRRILAVWTWRRSQDARWTSAGRQNGHRSLLHSVKLLMTTSDGTRAETGKDAG